MRFPERGAGPEQRVLYLDVAEACRREPGSWFKVRTAETEDAAWALSQKIKTGRRAAFRPAGHFSSYTSALDVFAAFTPPEPKKKRARRRPRPSIRRAAAAQLENQPAEKDGT